VDESPSGRGSPEVGTLSPDGSRRWDGKLWVLIRNDYPLEDFSPSTMRRPSGEFSPDRRSFRLGRVVVAAIVALVIIFIRIPAPTPGSLDAALTELAVVTVLRFLVAFAAVVVIISLGRQGIDMLILRAMLTVFLIGAALVGLIIDAVFSFPIPVTPRIPWPFVVILGGLILAVTLGPVFALPAALANLFWYRSLKSLRAQLGLFNRLILATALVANIGFSLWASVYEHNLSGWVLGGGPAAATLVMLFLLPRSGAGTAVPSV
jgi:hypothetical protein